MLFLAFLTFLLFFYVAYRRPLLALVGLAALLPAYNLRFTISLPFGALAKYGGLPATMLEVIIWAVFFGWLFSLLCPPPSVIPASLSVIPAPPSVIPAKAGIQLLFSRLQKIKWPLGLFFTASIISVFVAPDLYRAIGLWRAFFLEPALIFLMILAVVKSPALLPLSKGEERGGGEKIIFGLSLSAIFVSALAIGQRFFDLPILPPWDKELRVMSVFTQPNMVGLYLGPLIPLFFYKLVLGFSPLFGKEGLGLPRVALAKWGEIFNKFSIKKLLIISYWILTIISSITAIILAQSDGAIAGVLAGAAIFCLLWNKKTRLFLLIAFLLFCFFAFLSPQLSENIKEKLLLGDWSGIVRQNIWRESWAMLKDNWLFGAGVGGYPLKILPYHASRAWMEVYPMPHTIIFNFWSELGLLGLGAFLWLLEKFYKMCYKLLQSSPLSPERQSRGYIITAISAMTVIIVHGLVDVPILKNDLAILFWIIYAMPIIALSRSSVIPDADLSREAL